MSGTPTKLPGDVKTWEDEMAKMGLTGQTIHGAELASASKFEYKQFLLLQVIWVPRRLNYLPTMLPGFKDWITKAETMLKTYQSWGTYCQGLALSDAGEGNFTIARHYQLQVANTRDDTDPLTLATPIAHRTRSRELARKFADMNLATSSRSNNISKTLDIEDTSLDDPFDISETSVPVTPLPGTPSPFREITPAPKELENVLYLPTKDEQIVNCALITFLNALTIPFKLANNWTLHRKAFKAIFDDASFEARTDGYLDDRQGNAQAIIEVKPVTRSKKQIFLTVAQYDGDYIKYLADKNHRSESRSFMTMNQFGPCNTLEATHMRYLGPILLAISLRADAEIGQS
ncbi:hypothetical protein BO94DRAFT_557653 [Aspergillus sclerotioniger CBS 115572]|uniref:Uncharacterized protein n=1 Tax=Aspergillus sclerotioniger CBS 115572 TaxID=1450535 RepID=A0A317WDK6_9EURO|nr:hypothetical protein BO94DRAFT_557653 [Aspergillus sclerotioniger CBS 115572]PWY83811.1 hypothetical protein BO94DRAFT_557653 [Aspergillus sclerotioniger CBS 115572]